MMHTASSFLPSERIEMAILLLRGQKVMLDADLADLYQIDTKTLIRAVKRNIDRFPVDFMFQLKKKEFECLRYQFGTSKKWTEGRGGRRYMPFAFTEQGVAMLSSVLRSKRAVQVNIAIMRAFVRLRQILASHEDLAHKLMDMEEKYDEQFRAVFEVIQQLMAPVVPDNQRRIGFRLESDES